MKETGRGILAIYQNADGNSVVRFEPVNGDVWMDRNELCTLFDVYMKTIDEALYSILKMNLFDMSDSCKCQRVVKGKRILLEVIGINLKVIIVLAFRLDSDNARILRDWAIERITGNHREKLLLTNRFYDYSLN